MEAPATVTVHFEQPFWQRLEKLAQLSGKSVAEIVELSIKIQMGWRPPYPPLNAEVEALKGSLPLLQPLDYKAVVAEELSKKYGVA